MMINNPWTERRPIYSTPRGTMGEGLDVTAGIIPNIMHEEALFEKEYINEYVERERELSMDLGDIYHEQII